MVFTDTHCHLYADEFNGDIAEVMQRANDEHIDKFYLPAIDSHTHNKMLQLEEQYEDKCIAMMGLHPCSVKENYLQELELVEQWLTKRKFAAVGEIGLDFYWDKTFAQEQHNAFRRHVELSLQYKLPIVIHTRKAMPETIAIVKQYAAKGARGIFHCFSGSYEEAREITKLGFYLGIGGVLTYKNSGLAAAIAQIDMQYLVLETDAPYLTPVPFRGKRNESSYLKYVAEKLAAVKNISVEEVAAITTANAEKIFGS
jgi:TatD DNase family protein